MLRDKFGDDYVAKGLAPRFSDAKWKQTIANAAAVRDGALVSSELVDPLDAFDVRSFERLIGHFWNDLGVGSARKDDALPFFHELASTRNPLGHGDDLPLEDSLRFIDTMRRASRTIFTPDHEIHKTLAEIATAVELGRAPRTISKYLPPQHEVVANFIGRAQHLEQLDAWLGSQKSVWILEGDGGKGKSAIAYHFAQGLSSTKHNQVETVLWLSAKLRKFDEGTTVGLTADFTDLETAVDSTLRSYGISESKLSLGEKQAFLLELFREGMPFIILDDVDSLDPLNEDVIHWFCHALPQVTPIKILMTSRRALFGFGAFTTKVSGFSPEETRRYLRNTDDRLVGTDKEWFSNKGTSKLLHETCEGSPLYLEDLVRYVTVSGLSIELAAKEWRERKGDKAREYALRREFDMVSIAARHVLLAAALSHGRVSARVLQTACDLSEPEFSAAIATLQRFHLISYPSFDHTSPEFEINSNLRALVLEVFADTHELKAIAVSLKQLLDVGKPRKMSVVAARSIRDAVALVRTDKYEAAANLLIKTLEQYPSEAALLSHLGWVYTKMGPAQQWPAIEALKRAVDLKHDNTATYQHLTELYIQTGEFDKAYEIAEAGLELEAENLELLVLRSRASIKSALEMIRVQSREAASEKVYRARKSSNAAIRFIRTSRNLGSILAEVDEERMMFDRLADN